MLCAFLLLAISNLALKGCNTAFVNLLAEQLKTIGNWRCIWKQMSDLEGFACLVTYQGNCFPKWKECSFLCHLCVCLPAWLLYVYIVCGGICILLRKTEIHIPVYCPWAQTGTLFSIELHTFSDLFWNLDLCVKYLNINATAIFGMLSFSHGNMVCGCGHSSEWKWLPGAFLAWILQNHTQLLKWDICAATKWVLTENVTLKMVLK